MRFATYGRKSVYSDKSDSVDNQERMCREYADLKFSGQIESFEVYQDEGFTGANTDRPGLERLLRDVKDGLVDALIVYQLDRISRDVRDFSNIYALLEEKRVMFVSIKENIDTATPIGKAMMYVTMVFAQMERETIANRVTDNMLGLAKKGFWTGGPAPLGYHCGRVTAAGKNHSMLVPDPDGKERVSWLFDTFLESGSSTRRLQAALTEDGYRTEKGRPVSTAWLYRVLTCPYYAAADEALYDYFVGLGCQIDADSPRERWTGSTGAMIYGRIRNDGKSQRRNDPKDWTVCVGVHVPLLPSEKWIAAQLRFRENVFDKTPRREPPLLKSVVRCRCGRLMHVSWQGKYSFYDCSLRREHGPSACDMRQIATRKLDEAALDVFRRISADPSVIEKYAKKETDKAALEAGIREKERRIGKLEREIENLAASLAEGQGSSAVRFVYQQMEQKDLEAGALRREVAELRAKEREADLNEKAAGENARRIRSLMQMFDGLSARDRNAVVKEVTKECVWDGETLFLKL